MGFDFRFPKVQVSSTTSSRPAAQFSHNLRFLKSPTQIGIARGIYSSLITACAEFESEKAAISHSLANIGTVKRGGLCSEQETTIYSGPSSWVSTTSGKFSLTDRKKSY
jgi:hypothetical protein